MTEDEELAILHEEVTKIINKTYKPEVFDVSSIEEAKKIILIPNAESTDDRWDGRETIELLRFLRTLPLGPQSIVVDYGVGIGRVAKPLIDYFNCVVIGVDISQSMLDLSKEYVSSPNYVPCNPDQLMSVRINGQPLQADWVFAIWTLQHIVNLKDALSRIKTILKPGGTLFVLNDLGRCIPCHGEDGKTEWLHDYYDIYNILPLAMKKTWELKSECEFYAMYENSSPT